MREAFLKQCLGTLPVDQSPTAKQQLTPLGAPKLRGQ